MQEKATALSSAKIRRKLSDFQKLLWSFLLIPLFTFCGGCSKPKPVSPKQRLTLRNLYLGILPTPATIKDVSCYDGFTGQVLNQINHLEEKTIRYHAPSVSNDKTLTRALHCHEIIMAEFSPITDKRSKKLQSILDNLLNVVRQELPKTKETPYTISLIKSNKGRYINAFTTSSGYIYMTTDLYQFCRNDAELAYILAHEIAHNLLGHCTDHDRRKQIATNTLGNKWGKRLVGLYEAILSPIGKSDELACDLSAAYITYTTGLYDPEAGLYLYQRFNEQLGSDKSITRMLSSHPHSQHRMACLGNYLFEAKVRAKK